MHFFYFSCILLLLLLFLLLLFCRRQNSYLLFQCLVECQQEGVSTAFFPCFSISFSCAQSQKLNFQFGTVFFSVATLLMRHENSFSRVHVSLTFIISIFVSVPLIIKKRDCGLRCTNCNEINTNFYFYSIFVVAAADFFVS